jgi:flagellin
LPAVFNGEITMPQIINTNIASLNAQRNLDKAQSGNDTALQRLSSGLRINSAKDDAAGLSISTRFDAQISGTSVAIRNAGDGISLSQTAEGALDSITSNLQRVRELAVQAANGTNDDIDREALNAEAQQLISEIQRTSESTTFNGINLLDGSFDTSLQVGANAGQTLDVAIGAVTTDVLGVADTAGLSAVGSDNAIGNGDLSINGVAIASSSAADDTFSTDNAEASAIAKVAAINKSTDETGVTAFVNENSVSGSAMTNTAAAQNGTLTVNGVNVEVQVAANETAATRSSITQAINSISDQTGVTAIDSGEDANGITLVAADGRNIELSADLTNDFGGGITTSAQFQAATGLSAVGDSGAGTPTSETYEGGYTLVSNDGSDIEVAGGDGTGNGNIANAGLTSGTFSGSAATLNSEATTVNTGGQEITGGTASNVIAVSTYTAGDITATFSDGTQVTSTGTTLAGLAGDINGTAAVQDNVLAYEKISVVLDMDNAATTLVATDTLTLGGGAAVTYNGDNQEFADAINNTDYSARGFEVQATYDAANDDITLDVKMYGGAATAFTVATSANDVQASSINGNTAAAGTLAGNTVTGTLAIESLDDTLTSVTIVDTNGNNLVNNDAETVDLTRVNGLESGDLVINDVTIGGAQASDDTATATRSSNGDLITSVDKSANGIAIAEAINRNSNETGVTATVQETKVIGGDGSNVATAASNATAGDSADIFINGVNVGAITLANQTGTTNIDTEKAKSDALDAINAVSGQTGVTAEDNGVSLTLTAADGRAISIAVDTNAAANTGTSGDGIAAILGLDASVDGIGAKDFAGDGDAAANITTAEAEALAYETTYSSVSLSAAGQFTVEAGANGASELEALGLTSGTYGGGEKGQFLKDVDISTVDGANLAINAIDNALEQVASERANLGATQNRLDSTISNLAISQENLSAANSRIKDADFAAETAELSRTQVLIQAGISVLAQANARPQQVLSLLG